MDLILGHISLEPVRCPELKNIGLTVWAIQKTSFWFSGHVATHSPNLVFNTLVVLASMVSCDITMNLRHLARCE